MNPIFNDVGAWIKRYGLELSHAIGATRVETLLWDDPRRAFQLPADVLSAGMEPTDRNTKISNPEDYRMPVSALVKK